MAIADAVSWIDEFGRPGTIWFAKRLAANDTRANDTHQAGPYMPKEFLFELFPSINQPDKENPDCEFDLYVDSHADHRLVRAVWYNNKLTGKGTRNETRLTRFGGSSSALLDPDSTGSVAVFAFILDEKGAAIDCHVWVCRDEIEEDIFEERLGPVEPKKYIIWKPGTVSQLGLFGEQQPRHGSCWLAAKDIPSAWLQRFPSGEELIRRVIELRPKAGQKPDERLIRRRQCEYEMFRSAEEAVYLPRIKDGFGDIDAFVGLAQSILQSRKSRSGNSLELHAREILIEEGFKAGGDFAFHPVIEGNKRPDFLFPSQAAYDDRNFPELKLRMMAAKTTCKDRWRQILNEADRIRVKHLLTLQEGVSEGQFREMNEAGVRLVVPAGLHESYPKEVRPHLIEFESFIGDVRLLQLASKG